MSGDAGTGEKAAPKGRFKGKRGKLLLVLPILLVAAGTAFFFLRPSGAQAESKTPPPPVPGAIVQLDPITVNLAGGRYLKLGLALQATADAGEEVSGAKALDLAIEQFSGRSLSELASREGREKAKEELTRSAKEAYEGEVYEVYFTTFVMQ